MAIICVSVLQCPEEACNIRFTAKASMQRHALNIHSREISDINQKRSSSNSETSYPVDTDIDGEKDTEANADADMLLLCGACPKNDTLEDEPVAGNDERSEEKSDAETPFNPTTSEENLHVWIYLYTCMF